MNDSKWGENYDTWNSTSRRAERHARWSTRTARTTTRDHVRLCATDAWRRARKARDNMLTKRVARTRERTTMTYKQHANDTWNSMPPHVEQPTRQAEKNQLDVVFKLYKYQINKKYLSQYQPC
jgi:hypothetical protein